MREMWKSLALAAGVIFSLPNHVVAQSNNSGAATFIYQPDSGNSEANFTFTITVNPANKDMWFRMSAPSAYSWIAVGSGSSMSSSTMFIAYEASDNKKTTLSSRKAHDRSEPIFYKDLGLNVAVPSPQDSHPNGIIGDTYFVAGRCSNCTDKAAISTDSKSASFIFAIGPQGKSPRSDSVTAPLRQHAIYGTFSLDMKQASGESLPSLGGRAVGVAKTAKVTQSRERGSSGHALVMCVAFVIIFPLGIFLLRVLEKVNLHMYAQSFGLLLVLIGFVSGMVLSKRYNRSKNYSNGHQIIGILVFLLLIAQWVLGFLHHRTYQRTQQPTWMIKPHKYGLGPLTMALGIINAAFGFNFSLAGGLNLVYVPLVLVVFIILTLSIATKRFWAGRRAKKDNNAMFGGPAPAYGAQPYSGGAYEAGPAYNNSGAPPYLGAGHDSGRSDIALNNLGAPPSYSQQPVKPRDMI
ncbi:CBD9-like protein [Tothia fuscella]|uniref:CBD9-like protein n=1 Tax=Tothia fuscella TaxID=1048955 RepID=A0A9P4NH73_9PEZI|nr:CBD9-like protein [Tothia fuscella]